MTREQFNTYPHTEAPTSGIATIDGPSAHPAAVPKRHPLTHPDRRAAGSATFTASARRLGIVSAGGTVILSIAYAIPLIGGLLTLSSPDAPIGDPWFPMMEVLIILTMPLMMGMMVTTHAWASPDTKTFATLAIVFMGLATVVTCSVHFVILTVTHQAEFAGQPWLPLLISFRWISVTYALDILAWDIFFALAALFAAPAFSAGSHLTAAIRYLMTAAGVLALAGLSGVVLDNSQFRSIGIVGYAAVFPVAAVLQTILFHRSHPSGPAKPVPATRKPYRVGAASSGLPTG